LPAGSHVWRGFFYPACHACRGLFRQPDLARRSAFDAERLATNLLSSMPLTLNLLAPTDPEPSAGLANAISFVDRSIGQMIGALYKAGFAESTLIKISAKHGQSAIDVTKRMTYSNKTVIAGPIGSNFAFDIGDDGVLIWLKDNTGTKTADAVAALNAYGNTGIGEWLSGPFIPLFYKNPAYDSRTPDVIGISKIGTIYTSGTKLAEHGGFNEDDTHVALLVAHPDIEERSSNAAVATTQIAPTILKVLGLDPQELEAARLEGTTILPGLQTEGQ
jgi:arylsulfatase A-like enzyme